MVVGAWIAWPLGGLATVRCWSRVPELVDVAERSGFVNGMRQEPGNIRQTVLQCPLVAEQGERRRRLNECRVRVNAMPFAGRTC